MSPPQSPSPPPQLLYVPKLNAVEHATAAVMVAEAGVGHVITMGPQGLASSTIPLVANRDMSKLAGHFARDNPHTLEILQGMKDGQGVESLVIFSKNTGYISPAWYPSKKKNGGKEVPTWNYDLVHVRGKLRIVDDRDFVQKVLFRLVLSCLVLSCLVLSCLVFVLSCLVLSCLVFPYLVLSCLVLSCLVLFSVVLFCLVLFYFILSCLILSCLVLSFHVVSFRFLSCLVRVLSCRVFHVLSCLFVLFCHVVSSCLDVSSLALFYLFLSQTYP
jgi:hypothetical protein